MQVHINPDRNLNKSSWVETMILVTSQALSILHVFAPPQFCGVGRSINPISMKLRLELIVHRNLKKVVATHCKLYLGIWVIILYFFKKKLEI